MMGRKGMIYVLVFIAGLLVSENEANGMMGAGPAPVVTTTLAFESTTVAGAVVSSNVCTSHAEAGQHLCSAVSGISDIDAFLASFDETKVCTHSMLQYGCASLEDMPASTITAILKCFLVDNNAVTSQESFSLLISKVSLEKLSVVLNSINNQVPSSSISDVNKHYLLTAVWEKLYKDPNNLSPGVLATWFQEKMYLCLPVIDMNILNCMNTLALTCDAFEAIIGALDVAYSKFDQVKQEEIGSWITRFIQAHSCGGTTTTLSIQTYYKSFVSNINFASFSIAFTSVEMGSAIDAFTDFQLAQYVTSSNVFTNYETASVVLQLLATKDFNFIFNFLITLQAGNYDHEIMYSLLYDTLIKINSTEDPLCKPKLKSIFQGKLSYLFKAINSSILDLIVVTDCSDFQDIYGAIDEIHESLTADQQQLVYEYRLKFLNGELLKSGSGCTYGFTSSDWLKLNLGKSVSFFTYSQMINFHHSFDGYAALSQLNQNQTLDLVLQTGILSLENPDNYEARVSSLVIELKRRGFQYIQLFLMELRLTLIRLNIHIFIVNSNVRTQFLQGVWETLTTEFVSFTNNNWYTWFYEYLYIFLPSFSSQQLSVLSNSVVQDCSNLQTIVGGLDQGYEQMNQESGSDVANWITGYLRNDTSRCLGGDNWLTVNFHRFRIYITITVIRELNPAFNLLDSLSDLSAAQIGQAVVTEEGALTSVSYMHTVFEVITNSSQPVENLGVFWDSFVVEYEQVEQFSEEVKYSMLTWSVDEIAVTFSTFTAQEYTLWFEKRLYPVTVVINSTILQEIPLNIDCDSYKAVVKAFSINYGETVDTSREDVFNFFTNFLEKGTQCSNTQVNTVSYITSSFGSYSVEATFEQLINYYPAFNTFESGVFATLTETQLGDMMVVSEVYQSAESVTTVFQYLQTLSVESVDNVMAQFTLTAQKKNIQIVESVGQQILHSYFNIIKTSLSTYSHTQIKHLFEIRISVLIRFFNESTLNMFAIQNCDTLVVIVHQLDTGFTGMSDKTKSLIAYWIYGLIKSKNFQGCTSISMTTSVWSETVLKRFFGFITLKELEVVFSSLDVLSVINSTSTTQKVEFLVSKEEILKNVQTTMTVLEALPQTNNVVAVEDLYTFLGEFTTAYETLNVQSMSSEVREESMTFLFTSLVSDLNSVTTEEIKEFKTKFHYFLEGTTVEVVNKIPVTINCDMYGGIFSGFGSAIQQLSDDVNTGIFNRMIAFLDHQHTGSSDVCADRYHDSVSYVQNIFFEYKEHAQISQMESYYSEFNAYEVLTQFNGKQLGNLLMSSTAISDQFKAVPILTNVGKLEYSEISSFMSEITLEARENNIHTLPDANIETLIYKTVWDSVVTHLKTPEDYVVWFNGSLDLILSSVPSSAIEALPLSVDCTSQSYLVESFGKVYSRLKDDQKNTVYGEIKGFNMNVKTMKGVACETESGSSEEWVKTFYGPCVEKATFQDLQQANPNFTASSALTVLSAVQCADFAIESNALQSEETTVHIFNSLESIERVQDFLNHMNEVAPEQLSNSPVVEVIVSKTFEIISENFKSFTKEDWISWTQETLKNVLFAVNENELESIEFPLSCAYYQELVKGFDNVFDKMTEDTQKNVYNKCIKQQLSKTHPQNGVRCGEESWKSQEWVDNNFASFYTYANVSEFFEWNVHFQATSVIDNLNPEQLAEVAVQSIEKEEVACQVAGRVQQFTTVEASSFLGTFHSSLQMTSKAKITNVEIGYKFLSASVTALSSAFSKFGTSEWEGLFSTQLQPFLFAMDAEQMTSIMASADCNGYATIVKGMDSVYSDLSPDTQKSLSGVLTSFLKKKPSGTCPVSGEDSSTSVKRLFGKLMAYLTYEELTTYISNFDGLSAIDLMSPEQTASLAFSGDILSDASKSQVLVNRISAMSFSQVDSFLSSFQAIAQQRAIGFLVNVNIQASLFSAIYGIVSRQFSTFTNEQWSNYWTFKFSLFLSSITESQIQLIPENINCNAYQSVISGCNSHYSTFSQSAQNAIYQKAKSYLTAHKQFGGPACPVSSGGSGLWFEANLGILGEQASIQDITQLNKYFVATESIQYLTADQLGQYVASNDVLSDKDKIVKVMGGITSATIAEFMDSFNAGIAAAGITQITSVVVKKFFLGEIFCKLSSIFSSFTVGDYSNWFQGRLSFFKASIDAKALGFISTDISCDSLAAIMGPLITATNPENPDAIYSFSKSVLEAQKKATGFACNGAGMNSRTWVTKYFGNYISFGTWEEITSMYPSFQVTEAVDLLTDVQLASASASSSVLHSSGALTSVVFSFNGSLDGFLTYMSTLKNSYLLDPSILSNNKIRDTLMMAVAEYVFSFFGNLDLETTQSWLSTVSFLLPGTNSTMLQNIPLDISCEQYQAIVSAFDGVFSNVAPTRKQDFAAFQKRFLLHQYTTFGEACTHGLSSTFSYIEKNIGLFCNQFTAEEIAQFNPSISSVSFTQFCTLS